MYQILLQHSGSPSVLIYGRIDKSNIKNQKSKIANQESQGLAVTGQAGITVGECQVVRNKANWVRSLMFDV